MKRQIADPVERSQQHKKQKQDRGSQRYEQQRDDHRRDVCTLPPSTSQSAEVPAYVPFTVSAALPALPPVFEGPLAKACFTHRSAASYHRSSSTGDITYERLEFVGDAYIELIATRLIFERYYNLTVGQQSQLRELLVKNETLAEYSRAYGFEKRIEISQREKMQDAAAVRLGYGGKGLNKVLGDVFEAYIAAVVMSDTEHGFAVAEKWLTTLWAPKLQEVKHKFRASDPTTPISSDSVDPLATYNPTAKADLQKRILSSKDVKLEYVAYQKSLELKGTELGQNMHFIALYLTGYGYQRKELGKGSGKNKVEAGNWAAQKAMFGEAREIVEECEKVNLEAKERRRVEKEKKEAASGGAAATGNAVKEEKK